MITPKVSRKRFTQNAKRLKRKGHITGAQARDQLARGFGYADFAEMNKHMMVMGEWKS